jgi:hypothetical protein
MLYARHSYFEFCSVPDFFHQVSDQKLACPCDFVAVVSVFFTYDAICYH